ncbi:type II toxin-antitoxin system RatA family toxin [Hyphomicrobium sulfonivorans]|uniref:type II toxin-antitoxin system RatA family toxin n=1 Tax=Hyphomicrobium sulfonivorans TaxID=121290 RepID=UPI00156DB726|nr:SRPBCC family protein [Hyphomicrobium sulfonivorans]MBI1650511.1 SRPBCC family protein [Hyphomicrobium sulfonivorans]NSL72131.1 ubiquinone-binding protein [Hyphomicrobium sulfonivorans]
MPTFETTRRMPFTADQMFAVVADVQHYPLFVPLCERLEITARQDNGAEQVITAIMAVGYQKISEKFTSRVTLRPDAREIDVVKIDGPFQRLTNRWRFRDVPGGCEVHFFIDYAFASKMLSLLMGAVFDKAVRKYTDAFEARARTLYPATPNTMMVANTDAEDASRPRGRADRN